MKLLLITDQLLGYDLKMIGFPVDKEQLDLIEKLIPENAKVYADKLMLNKIKSKLVKYHYVTELKDAEYIITDCDFSAAVDMLDEIIIMRKFRSYPHTKMFSIKQLTTFNQKPTSKQSYTFEKNKRIDIIQYEKQKITPTYAIVSKEVLASMPMYMYREKPDNPSDTGWRFFSGNESDEFIKDSDNFEFMPIYDLYGYEELIKTWIKDVPEGYEINLTNLYNKDCCFIYGNEAVVYEEYIIRDKAVPIFGLIHGAQFSLPHSQLLDGNPDEYVVELKAMTLQEKLQITDGHKNPIIKELTSHEVEA